MGTVLLPILCVLSVLFLNPALGWDPGQEYVFEYNARTVMGLWDLQSQFATLAIQSKVTVQSVDRQTLRFKLSGVAAKVHANYEGNPYYEEQEASDFKNLDIDIGGQQVDIRQLEQLEAPFDVIHNSGSVSTMVVSSGDPSWSVNLKKGLVSQLQLNISRPGSPNPTVNIYAGNALESNIAVDVYEHSITGHCKVNLQISRLPEALVVSHSLLKQPSIREICQEGNIYEVIKTKDFDQCQTTPMLSFLTPSTLHCKLGSTRCGEAMQRTAYYKYLGCGETPESMTLLSYEGYGELFAKPFLYKTEQLVHTVISTLKLRSRMPFTQQLNAPSNPRKFTDLDHVFPEDKVPEVPSAELDLHGAAQHASEEESAFFDKKGINLLREVARSLNTSSTADIDVVDRLDTVSRGLSLLSVSQLNQSWTVVKNEMRNAMRGLFLDAVVSSGSNPAAVFIVQLVEGREVDESTASSLLAVLGHNLRAPTRPLLQRLMDLLKSDLVQSSAKLRRSLAITLGGMLGTACVSQSSSRYTWPLIKDRCTARDPIIVDEFLSLLKDSLSSAEENIDYFSTLLALSKLGSADILPILLPYIRGSETGDDTARRAMAVSALKPLARISPQNVWPLLLSLADNISERPEVRMVSIALCFHSNAPLAVWQKLAYRTWFESSRQVAAFIYTTLKAVSEIQPTSPEMRKVAEKAKLVLPLSKAVEGLDKAWSRSSVYSSFLDDVGLGFSTRITDWVQSDAPYPVFLDIPTVVQYGPLLASYGLELWNFGPEQTSQPVSPLGRFRRSSAPRELFAAGFSELDTLWSQNRLLRRSDDLKVNILHLNLMNSIHLIYDVENLRSRLESMLVDRMRANPVLDVDSAVYFRPTEFDLQLPSDIGIPIRFTMKASSLLALSGKLDFRGAFKFDAASLLADKFTSQLRSDLPFCGKYISSGVDARVEIRGPRHLEYDGPLTWKPHDEVTDLFYYHIKPYTTSRDFSSVTPVTEAPEFHSVQVNPQKERSTPLPNPFGIDLRLIQQTEEDYEDFASWLEFFRKWDLKLLLQLASAPLTVRNQVYRLQYQPETSSVGKIVFLYKNSDKCKEDPDMIRFASGTQLKAPSIPSSLGEIKSGKESSYQLEVKVSQKDGSSSEFQARLSGMHGEGKVTYQTVLEKTEGDVKSAVCVAGTANWNNVPSFGLSSSPLERFIQLKITSGTSCDSSVVGVVNITALRSEEARVHARESDPGKTCVEQESHETQDSPQCAAARILDGSYNQYEISADLSDAPACITSKLTRLNSHVTHLLYPYITNVSAGHRNGNLWSVKTVRNPVSSNLDVEVCSPTKNLEARDVRLSEWKFAPFLKTQLESLLQTRVSSEISESERCYVNRERVVTFDQVPYDYRLNSCYHTLVTDCTKQKRFIVLGRSVQSSFVLRVVTDKDVIDIDPAGSVNVNGVTEALDGLQKYGIDERGVTTVTVKREADGVIRVELFDMKVKFSPSQITITPPASLSGKTCGLCGDFDKEVLGEFKTGSRCLVSSGALMASAFQVSYNDNCPDVREDLATELKSQTTICFSPDEKIRSALPVPLNV